MPIKSREYLSSIGMGSAEDCKALMDSIVETIRSRFDSAKECRRATFLARVLWNKEGWESEGLTDTTIQSHCGDKLPVLFLIVSYDPLRVSADEMTQLESKFELQLFGTAESNADFR